MASSSSSLLFGLYTYKFGAVPFYVPFGHAILFSTGLLIAELPSVVAHEARVRWGLLAFHAGLFDGAVLALGDSLSAIFGALFVLILYRKRAHLLYLIMGVLVLLYRAGRDAAGLLVLGSSAVWHIAHHQPAGRRVRLLCDRRYPGDEDRWAASTAARQMVACR